MVQKYIFLSMLSACFVSNLASAETALIQNKDTHMVNIATFDSGFGGFFTAKSIEDKAQNIVRDYDTKIRISHFGDTKNAPYGEKTPEKIAAMTTENVLNALAQGADMVFIACNTASTQYSAVEQAVEKKYPNRGKDVISIINASAENVKKQLDIKLETSYAVHFAILATPATIKAGAYPTALTSLYDGVLRSDPLNAVHQSRWLQSAGKTIDSFTKKAVIDLKSGKKIYLYQVAPANWVDLIEHEGTLKDKHNAIENDLTLLENLLPKEIKLDGVGEFCTHYPVFDKAIQLRLSETEKADDKTFFIKQGPLMAEIFDKKIKEKLMSKKRPKPLAENSDALKELYDILRPTIDISGDNVDATKRLAKTVFPNEREPVVNQVNIPEVLHVSKSITR
jgi:glutamate racemase